MNQKLIDTYKRILGEFKFLSFKRIEVSELLSKINVDAVISPANSYGVMTGGIDNEYKKIFPNIQEKVFEKINDMKIRKDSTGKYFIPVGQNLIVSTKNAKCRNIILCPTMFLPKDINMTNNVYYAFTGILNNYYNTNYIICCPGLGTGIGNISFEESAYQIKFAIVEFLSKKFENKKR
ncbi:macro domain containing protein [Catovirus CTV1]|uniref:Macro domain containing protein n=1 Tax=Catovirus CTV1 TaxID=1977631 RepID=A0A1V0SAS4_9VIRU|nr:macro domain containing protein [Catovirus CTV1]